MQFNNREKEEEKTRFFRRWKSLKGYLPLYTLLLIVLAAVTNAGLFSMPQVLDP